MGDDRSVPYQLGGHGDGMVTACDKLAIQWTSDEMKQVAANFAELSEDDAMTRYDLGRDVQDWKVQWAQADVRSHPDADTYITPVLYRPNLARQLR